MAGAPARAAGRPLLPLLSLDLGPSLSLASLLSRHLRSAATPSSGVFAGGEGRCLVARPSLPFFPLSILPSLQGERRRTGAAAALGHHRRRRGRGVAGAEEPVERRHRRHGREVDGTEARRTRRSGVLRPGTSRSQANVGAKRPHLPPLDRATGSISFTRRGLVPRRRFDP